MADKTIEFHLKVNADTAGADKTNRALQGVLTTAQKVNSGLTLALDRNRAAATAFNASIRNGDVALRKWGALLGGAGLIGLLRNYALQARQADTAHRELAAQIGETAAREQEGAQSAGDYQRQALALGRAINTTGDALKNVVAPALTLVNPLLVNAANVAKNLVAALGPIGPAALIGIGGLAAYPKVINGLTAAVNPLRTALVGLTGNTFTDLNNNVALLTTRYGALNGSATLLRGTFTNLHVAMRTLSLGAMGLGALAVGWSLGKTLGDAYAESVQRQADALNERANQLARNVAEQLRLNALITDQKGANDQLAPTRKKLEEADKRVADLQAKIDRLNQTFGRVGAAPGYGTDDNAEITKNLTLARIGKQIAATGRELTEAKQQQIIAANEVRNLTDGQAVAARIARNEAAESAKEEEARIQALVAKLSDLRDLAADLDFQKLSPQGQFASLGMQIDALKGKLAALPAPDATSRESINRHLAQQLDLQNQIAQAEQKRAQITKTLDADAKAAADKSLAARKEDLAASEQIQQNLLDQVARERELIALRADLTPSQKQEGFNDLLNREKTILTEIVRLKKEELVLAADPLNAARLQGEIEALESRIANPGASTQPALGKLAAQRQDVAAMDAGKNSAHYNSVGEGMEGALLSQIQQIGTEGDIVAGGLSTAFGGAISGIQSGIEGLINRTQTWGQALRNIGSTILSGVVSAIAQMFAQWIAGEVARFALENVLGVKRKAANTAEMTQKTAIAGATCVAQMGPWGLAAFGAAMAVIMGAAMAIGGAFATGGLVTGPGTSSSDDILARVSNGEFIMPADAVSHYGLNTMELIRAGALDLSDGINAVPAPLARSSGGAGAASSSGGGGGGEEGRPIIFAFFDTRQDAETFLASSEGEGRVMEIVKGRRHEIMRT